jgi:hypothetical protein
MTITRDKPTADNLADAREQTIKATADWQAGVSASQVLRTVDAAIRYLQTARDSLRIHAGD